MHKTMHDKTQIQTVTLKYLENNTFFISTLNELIHFYLTSCPPWVYSILTTACYKYCNKKPIFVNEKPFQETLYLSFHS